MTVQSNLFANIDDKNYLELIEGLKSQEWRLNNLYYIVNESKKIVLFKLNSSQKKFLREMWYFNIILKARQLGFSTFSLVFALDCCLWEDNFRVGLIAQTMDDASALLRDKVLFPYEMLPDVIKNELVKVKKQNSEEILFSNNSGIKVGTSLRGGTLNFVIITELGTISLKYPDKADEIKTGALNTVHEGQMITIESTAKGEGGLFYDLCKEAQERQQIKRPLMKKEFKFHFHAWWQDNKYKTDPTHIVFFPEEEKYFKALQDEHGVLLDDEQKAWYVLKWRTMRIGDSDRMKQEFPSTPKEAFETSIEGSYFDSLINKAFQDGRITRIPIESALPVNTFWDLGRNDQNVIWFHQRFGLQNRFIDFYQNNGEGLEHYAKILKEKGYVYGEHYLPHDVEVIDISRGDNKSRREVLEDLGVKPIITVDRIPHLLEGIEMTRNALPSCWFDEIRCKDGLDGLRKYRKEWDKRTGNYKSYPVHDAASHIADAFRQFAQGYDSTKKETKKRRRKGSWQTS